jgi:hypothetical protein
MKLSVARYIGMVSTTADRTEKLGITLPKSLLKQIENKRGQRFCNEFDFVMIIRHQVSQLNHFFLLPDTILSQDFEVLIA